MLRQSPCVALVVGIVIFAPALATLAVEQVRGESTLGTPLAPEMIADERPPPSATSPATISPGAELPNPESPLADIPLRTRHPSRTFLPGLPEVGLTDPASSLADTDETQVIQLVYDTYSRYSEREDGERVEFELDGFRTVYRPQFGKVAHYPDLMTLGTDWEIETTMRHYTLNERSNVWFEAEWLPVRNRNERMPHLIGKSALEILAIGADVFPAQRRTIAITTYRVKVSYLGRSEEYRASVRWRLDEEQNVEFSVVDNVVPEVGWAIGETAPPSGASGPARAELPFERAIAASTTTSCVANTSATVYSQQKADYNNFEHHSGRHEAVYIGSFDCSCDQACTSRCSAGFLASACQDYGDLAGGPDLEHRANRRIETKDGLKAEGHLEAAGCVSGLGCFVQSCPGGACGSITTQVSFGVLSISFSTTAPTILNASFDSSTTCARCTEQDPEDSQTPSDGPIIQGCAPDCGSPIVVDLDRGGFRFTDLAGGVRFDLDGDGHAEQVAWIAPGSGDGWLVLDRDGDGLITSGAELFGNYTPQPPSDEPHGYAALAVFDQPAAGGDGDGAITPADAVFAGLRLWIDANHDGVSQPDELIPLAAAGIRAIHLDYVTSARRDEHGNELRYVSRVRLVRGMTRSADVFLLIGD